MWQFSKPPAARFETARLTARTAMRQDYDAWRSARRSSEATLRRFEPNWAVDELSREAFAGRLRIQKQEMALRRAWPFLLFRRDNGLLIGGITLSHVRFGAARSGEIGYWLRDDASGYGFMQEAISGLAAFAFGSLRLERLAAACLPDNDRSIAVLTKAGFHQEGLARGYLEIAGRRRDHLVFARLRTDTFPSHPTAGPTDDRKAGQA